jgi:hypothetical protein
MQYNSHVEILQVFVNILCRGVLNFGIVLTTRYGLMDIFVTMDGDAMKTPPTVGGPRVVTPSPNSTVLAGHASRLVGGKGENKGDIWE